MLFPSKLSEELEAARVRNKPWRDSGVAALCGDRCVGRCAECEH